MKIAVINEISTADRNPDIIKALDGFDHEVLNVGMKCVGEPQLSAMQTGFLAALFLNAKKVDLVVGGCGTGAGFMIAVMLYPNVFCGVITSPLDAWLFRQINGGNCLSLVLNKGYGWGSDQNLKFIFEKFFSVESGNGYPDHRKVPQREARLLQEKFSQDFHIPMAEIIGKLDDSFIVPALNYPDVLKKLDIDDIDDYVLKKALIARVQVV